MMRVLALTLALCAVPAFALAEGATSQCQAGDEQCTEIPFDDDDVVDGTILRGSDIIHTSRGNIRRSSLIRVRTHFVNEIVQTAENI